MGESEKEVEAVAVPAISATDSNRDDNYNVYKNNRDLEYTPEEHKKVLRKIDLQLIPLLFVIYMLQVRDP